MFFSKFNKSLITPNQLLTNRLQLDKSCRLMRLPTAMRKLKIKIGLSFLSFEIEALKFWQEIKVFGAFDVTIFFKVKIQIKF